MGVNYSHLRDVVRVLGLNLSNGRYLARNDVEILFKLVPNKNITVQNLVKWRTKVEEASTFSCCRDKRGELNKEFHITEVEDYLIFMGVNVSEMKSNVVLDLEAKMKNEDISKKIIRTYITAREWDNSLIDLPKSQIAIGEFSVVLFGAKEVKMQEEFTERFVLKYPKLLEQKIENEKIGWIVEQKDLEEFLWKHEKSRLSHYDTLMTENVQVWISKEKHLERQTTRLH